MLSVIIPVFNGAKFLGEAIASIRRSQMPIEIIIVDDGSTDKTELVAKNLGEAVTYLRQENRGPAAARNRGLEIAQGEFVGFLDADDLWTGSHPHVALDYLQSHDVDLVFGQTQCFITAPAGPAFHTYQLGSAVCRRRLIDRIGGFNSQMRHGEDVDWFLRARDSGAAIARLPDVSLYFRMHPGNRPNVYQTSRGGLLSALHQSLQRRRSAN